MTVVFSLGGSVLEDKDFVKKFALLLRKKKKERFVVVVGGGKKAREVISQLEELGIDRARQDLAAIEVTRQNAFYLVQLLGGEANKKIPRSLEELLEMNERIIVCGGFFPGITTDAVACILAELFKAKRLINISNVPGLYDKDPRKYKDARLLRNITHDDLLKLARLSREPGDNFIFDIVAMLIAKRSKIPLYFIGKEIKEVEKAIRGKMVKGTVVK